MATHSSSWERSSWEGWIFSCWASRSRRSRYPELCRAASSSTAALRLRIQSHFCWSLRQIKLKVPLLLAIWNTWGAVAAPRQCTENKENTASESQTPIYSIPFCSAAIL
jgi:hypothetical protein